jgi:hypothetical protein
MRKKLAAPIAVVLLIVPALACSLFRPKPSYNEVKSIAYIKSQITDTGQITGRFTKESAEDLSLMLSSGPLPAPVKIVEEGSN